MFMTEICLHRLLEYKDSKNSRNYGILQLSSTLQRKISQSTDLNLEVVSVSFIVLYLRGQLVDVK